MFDPYCDCYVSVSCTLSLILSTIVTLVSRSLRVWSSMRLLWWCLVHFEFTSLRLLRLLRVSCSFSLVLFMPVTLVFLAILTLFSCALWVLLSLQLWSLVYRAHYVWSFLRLLLWSQTHGEFDDLCDCYVNVSRTSNSASLRLLSSVWRFLCLIFFAMISKHFARFVFDSLCDCWVNIS